MVVVFKLLADASLIEECDRNGVTHNSGRVNKKRKKHKTYRKRGEKHKTYEQWPFLCFCRAGVQREQAAGTQDSSINIKSTLLDFLDLDLAGSGCPVRAA